MKKSFIIVFVSLIVLIVLFIFLRPSDTPKLPISDSDSMPIMETNVTNVKSFSDTNKNVAQNNASSGTSRPKTVKPGKTPKPLPYPRISINYSMQKVSSIGSNNVDKNNTFIMVKLYIVNYGYRYFDAYPNNFRGIVRGEEIIPLINVSTGDTIDDVIPNGSSAKGDLVFITNRKYLIKNIIYVGKPENYNILYTKLSPSKMKD